MKRRERKERVHKFHNILRLELEPSYKEYKDLKEKCILDKKLKEVKKLKKEGKVLADKKLLKKKQNAQLKQKR